MTHFDEEKLTAYLLDEMGTAERFRLRRHLRACLRCQAGLAEIERCTNRITASYTAQTFPGSTRTDRARRRFFESYEQEFRLSREPRKLRNRWLRPLAAGAAAATAVVFAWFVLSPRVPLEPARDSPSEAAKLLEQVERAHAALLEPSRIVRQQFRIRETETRSSPNVRETRLEIWTDVLGSRAATRWTDLDGELIVGVWQPRADAQRVVYEADWNHTSPSADPPRKTMSLVELVASQRAPQQFNAGFRGWLRARPVEPIALWRERGDHWGGDGARVERLIVGGVALKRLVASRTVDGRRVELVLDIDAATDQVLRKLIRLETSDRAIEVELIVESSEVLPEYRLDEAIFEPDVIVRGQHPSQQSGRSETTAGAPAPAPSRFEIDRAEIGIRAALHRLGACRGEPIEVVRRPAAIEVRGLAEDDRRREEIVAAIAPLADAPFVNVDVQTVEELITQTADSPRQPPRRLASADTSDERSLDEPVAAALRSFLESRSPNREPETRSAAAFASHAVSLTQAMRREAWALQRLSERYGGASLGPDEQKQLSELLRDHLSAVRGGAQRLTSLTRPALDQLASNAPAEWAPGELESSSGRGWSASCNRLFETIREVEGLTSTLFAGAWTPQLALDRLEGSREQIAAQASGLLLRDLAAIPDLAATLSDELE